MRKIICIVMFLLLGLPAMAETATFFAMDTVMTLTVADGDDALMEACARRVTELETLFSVTDDASEVARLNREGVSELSGDTLALMKFALEMCADTGGALDITMYPVVRAWGFTTGEHRVPDAGELAELREKVDYSAVRLENGRAQAPDGVMVDLGSVAKGYVSDALADMLREGGVESALLDLGGNIYCVGAKEDGSRWRVGIRSPLGEGYCGALSVADCAVVTSGNYERYFEKDGVRYGHIFDPATGCPADNGILSTTVVGKSGALCDALSTALYVMGPERAAEYLVGRGDVEAVIVCADGRLLVTEGLKGCFTPMDDFEKWETEWIGR